MKSIFLLQRRLNIFFIGVIALNFLSFKTNAQVCFTPASPATIAVGQAPQSIVSADFNGDGFADLACCNENSSNVSVMLGNGDGTFSAAVNYSVVNAPYSIITGDFNGDGKIDLATTNLNSLSILLGNGSGGFGTAIVTTAGGGSQVGASADFNNDGIPDFIMPDGYLNSTISIVLGNGDGTFGSVTQFNDMGVSPQSPAAGDFNGDGNIDLAIANQVSNDISIMIGNGSGGFTLMAGSPFATGATPTSIVTKDFNGDGKLDLVTTNYGDNNISVFLGNGDGTFGSATNYGVGTNPRFVNLGDLNGDGITDLAVGNQGTNDVSVLLGKGDGTFTLAVNCCGTTSIAAGNGTYQAAIADFNNDGKMDLAAANRGDNDVSVLLNSVSGSAPVVTATANTPVCSSDTLKLTGGPGAMSGYFWSGPNGFTSSSQNSIVTGLTSADAGIYTLLVSNSTGCSGSANTPSTIINSAFVADAGADVSVCAGGSTNLNASGGAIYSWSPTTGLSCTSCNNPVANPTSTTTYFFTGTNGACHSTDSVVITVSSGIALNISPVDTTICSGSTATLIASGASSYSWSPANAGLSCLTCANTVASPSVSTTYIVSGSNGVCSGSDSVVVTVGNTSVGGKVTAARDTICVNTPGNLSLLGNSGNNIQWQSSTDSIHFVNAGDTTTQYKTPPLQQSTWYRATTGSGSCSAVSDTLKLFVPPALTASFSFIQTAPNQLTFNSDSSSGNIRSYHWDFGDGQTSAEVNPTHSYAKDTTYYVCLTLYDGSNCSYTFCRYSDVTDAVPTISAAGNWVVYPDPITSELIISTRQGSRYIQRIEMYDLLGRTVINKNIGNSTTLVQLDVSSLAKGMYYVMLRTPEADYVQRVLKQ